MKSIFREYDIRGIFEKELNEDIVKKIGYFLGKKTNNKVLVSFDARLHSKQLASWLISGLNFANKEVILANLLPTGVNYFGCFTLDVSLGIQITGSHNPPEYNGFKITLDKKPFFGEDIYSLGEEILNSDIKIPDTNRYIEYNLEKDYINFISKEFKHLENFDEKLVFDCGNGASGIVLDNILKKLNFKNYKILYKEPDGTFPNHHPDPSDEKNLEDIKKELKDYKYGFAYDGDGDRIAFLDKYNNYKGDILALFFAKNIQNPIIVSEVKASSILYDSVNKFGKAIMTKTGHSNIKVAINKYKAHLGAEVSGHLFFNDRYFGFDDAIYATFRIIELIQNRFDFNKEYLSLPKVFNTPEITINTTEEEKFLIIEKLKNKLKNISGIKEIIDIDGLRVVFEDGWGLIRASNTTPKLVTRFEAKDEKTAKKYQELLLSLL